MAWSWRWGTTSPRRLPPEHRRRWATEGPGGGRFRALRVTSGRDFWHFTGGGYFICSLFGPSVRDSGALCRTRGDGRESVVPTARGRVWGSALAARRAGLPPCGSGGRAAGPGAGGCHSQAALRPDPHRPTLGPRARAAAQVTVSGTLGCSRVGSPFPAASEGGAGESQRLRCAAESGHLGNLGGNLGSARGLQGSEWEERRLGCTDHLDLHS